MKKKNMLPEDIELKKFFNSIEIEKPSDDFTISVMTRIAQEKISVTPPKGVIPRLYYFLLIPLLTLIGSVLLLIQKHSLSNINFTFHIPDLSIIETWPIRLLENFQKIFSPTIFSICMASFLLYTFFILTNNKNLTEKS